MHFIYALVACVGIIPTEPPVLDPPPQKPTLRLIYKDHLYIPYLGYFPVFKPMVSGKIVTTPNGERYLVIESPWRRATICLD
jgi:hypothetical protein